MAFGEKLVSEHGAPQAVFHVAGNSSWGRPDLLTEKQWTSMIDVNLMGTVHVVEALIPPMMAARRPAAFAMVSSAAGLIGLPWHAAYSAAKFGIRGIAEVLRFDLEPYNIGIHLVAPGAVDTPLVHSIHISGIDRSDPEVEKTVADFQKHAVTPDEAAQSMLDGVRNGRYIIYTSPDIHLAYLAQRYVPPLYRVAMRVMQKRINGAAAGMLP